MYVLVQRQGEGEKSAESGWGDPPAPVARTFSRNKKRSKMSHVHKINGGAGGSENAQRQDFVPPHPPAPAPLPPPPAPAPVATYPPASVPLSQMGPPPSHSLGESVVSDLMRVYESLTQSSTPQPNPPSSMEQHHQHTQQQQPVQQHHQPVQQHQHPTHHYPQPQPTSTYHHQQQQQQHAQ
eukprot:14458634-Ditylum_brightwellii.AAC.1